MPALEPEAMDQLPSATVEPRHTSTARQTSAHSSEGKTSTTRGSLGSFWMPNPCMSKLTTTESNAQSTTLLNSVDCFVGFLGGSLQINLCVCVLSNYFALLSLFVCVRACSVGRPPGMQSSAYSYQLANQPKASYARLERQAWPLHFLLLSLWPAN